jgi:hypothetical protein
VIKFISLPMRKTQANSLRAAFREFQRAGNIRELLGAAEEIRAKFGEPLTIQPTDHEPPLSISRDDLRLICFDVICA